MLKMILEAQIRSRLTTEQLAAYTKIANATGQSLVEVAQEMGNVVQPEDYQEWLRVIREIAEEEGINISKRNAFFDLAFDVLDNDPKMDVIGNDESKKLAIAKTLFHAHQVAAAHEQVGQATISAQENEEETVDAKSDLGLMSTIHSSINLQKVYKNGVKAGQNDVAENTNTKSDYARGTTRDNVWKLGHKHGKAGA